MIKNIKDIDQKIGNSFLTNKELAKTQLEEIILKMPPEIKKLIEHAFFYQRIPKEYLLSSILFAFSNACGLAYSIFSCGYTNYANLYLAIIGRRGAIKSPAMDIAVKPLEEFDNNAFKEYKEKTKDLNSESNSIVRRQLLIQNATIESAMYNHYKNKYSLGIYVDELYYLIEKMASKNTTEGSVWKTFLLQGNTNKSIDVSRRTSLSYRINRSYPTLLGSIQSHFVPKLFADGNLESGFIDRILFTSKITSNSKLINKGIPAESIENYTRSLINLLQSRDEIENSSDIETIQIELETDADQRLFDYIQELINREDEAEEIIKEYFSKMQINVFKLSLLVHLMSCSSSKNYNSKITLETIETAILIQEFYLTNFKIVVEENIQKSQKLPSLEDIIKVAIKNGANQKDVVAIAGVDKSTVSRNWNKIFKQLATDNLSSDKQ